MGRGRGGLRILKLVQGLEEGFYARGDVVAVLDHQRKLLVGGYIWRHKGYIE
jgi:hypothetical protein